MRTLTKRTLTKVTVAATAALAVIGVAGCSSGSSKPDASAALTAVTTPTANGPTVNVSGHGVVEATPDVMTVTMGVQTSDPSAQAALQRNNDRANALITALKAQGVAAKDIQTVDLNVSPELRQELPCDGLLRVEHRFREAAQPRQGR